MEAEGEKKQEEVDEYTSDSGERTPNHLIRKAMYQFYIYMKNGHLGKGNRIPIETCVDDNIRATWPEADGHYIGYKSE